LLKYFRINDPYRLIVLFILMLAVRLPVMISSDFLTYPELYNQLVGQRMGEGFKLYSEIWAVTGPFSGVVFGMIDLLFGKSQLTFQLVALIIVSFQCFLFNKMLLISKAFKENTYIPGVAYGILMSWFFDQYTLTPAILGLTFVLIAINGVLYHMDVKAKRDEHLLYIGLHLGVGILFYLPYVIFIPLILLGFLFFTGTVARRYVLFLYGALLPLFLGIMYYMFTGRLREVVMQYVYTLFDYPATMYFTWLELAIIFVLPAFFSLAGILKVIQGARLTVFQSNLSQFMILWLIFAAVYLFLTKIISPGYLVIFIPPTAFFISHYFFSVKKKWMAEVLFLVFMAGPVFFSLGTIFDFFITSEYVGTSKYIVEPSSHESRVAGKRILVLSNELRPYLNAQVASPFLDYQLARDVFTQPEYYDNLSLIADGFSTDMPEVIIDPNEIMEPIFNLTPVLARSYRKVEDGLYERIPD
jgi:hypothetical protein